MGRFNAFGYIVNLYLAPKVNSLRGPASKIEKIGGALGNLPETLRKFLRTEQVSDQVSLYQLHNPEGQEKM